MNDLHIIAGMDGKEYRVLIGATDGIQDCIAVDDDKLVFVGNPTMIAAYVEGERVEMHIPFGFTWDGASIPKFARWLVGHPLDAEFRIASLLHDAAYESRTRRVLNDVIFYAALRNAGVSKWKAVVMYAAVRAGGFVYYAGDTSRFWRGVRWLLKRS